MSIIKDEVTIKKHNYDNKHNKTDWPRDLAHLWGSIMNPKTITFNILFTKK